MFQNPLVNFGEDGISRLALGLKNTFIFQWAAVAREMFISICL